jgi:soluble lytic murein transglycosylase-like protein
MMVRRLHIGLAALALVVLTSTANAAETPATGWHVGLRSGFDLTCARLVPRGNKTRLYLHAGSEDYLDIATADIAYTEEVPLPDPSPEAATPASTNPAMYAGQPPAPPAPVDIASLTSGAGTKNNLDPDLIASIIHAESHENPRAVSHTGAKGLMQLMPGTAGQLGVSDSFNPSQNVEGGTAYINQLLVLYHDNLPLALAAYNAGPAAVAKYHGIPPYRETRAYVVRVIRDFNRRKLLALHAAPASTLVAKAGR